MNILAIDLSPEDPCWHITGQIIKSLMEGYKLFWRRGCHWWPLSTLLYSLLLFSTLLWGNHWQYVGCTLAVLCRRTVYTVVQFGWPVPARTSVEGLAIDKPDTTILPLSDTDGHQFIRIYLDLGGRPSWARGKKPAHFGFGPWVVATIILSHSQDRV